MQPITSQKTMNETITPNMVWCITYQNYSEEGNDYYQEFTNYETAEAVYHALKETNLKAEVYIHSHTKL